MWLSTRNTLATTVTERKINIFTRYQGGTMFRWQFLINKLIYEFYWSLLHTYLSLMYWEMDPSGPQCTCCALSTHKEGLTTAHLTSRAAANQVSLDELTHKIILSVYLWISGCEELSVKMFFSQKGWYFTPKTRFYSSLTFIGWQPLLKKVLIIFSQHATSSLFFSSERQMPPDLR